MATQRINPNTVKLHRSYSIGELADRLRVHTNTVRGWQRDGMQPIDSNRPIMFQGATVRAFHANRNASRKRPCPSGTLYCFRCRVPRPPALGMVDYIPLTAASGNLKAICATCDTIMHRRARYALLTAILPGCDVQVTEGLPRLSGSHSPSLNCYSERQTTA
jgi:hypothetical protein